MDDIRVLADAIVQHARDNVTGARRDVTNSLRKIKQLERLIKHAKRSPDVVVLYAVLLESEKKRLNSLTGYLDTTIEHQQELVKLRNKLK